jgi:hypothetical protein
LADVGHGNKRVIPYNITSFKYQKIKGIVRKPVKAGTGRKTGKTGEGQKVRNAGMHKRI